MKLIIIINFISVYIINCSTRFTKKVIKTLKKSNNYIYKYEKWIKTYL